MSRSLPAAARRRHRDVLARLTAAALVALAAACTTTPPGDGEGTAAAPEPASKSTPQPETTATAGDGAAAAPTPEPVVPALGLVTRAEPERPPAAQPAAVPGPEDLVGLPPGGVGALLGEPVFKRIDPPAQVWQYSDSACILDVFLYQDKDGAPYKVTYVAARGRSVAKVSWDDCVLGLLKRRHGAG